MPSNDLLQGLPPILPDGPIRALILGSFPSVKSLESQQYYNHPQNWFWRVLQHCGIVEDTTAPYEERVEQVRARNIAIWDLYEQVRREGSGDDKIRDAVPNGIGVLLESRGPFPILLNGRRLREFRRAFPGLEADLIALPSTSPRPLHWNTEESRFAAKNEWCSALSRNRDVPTIAR
ncbi:MAG: DNA-deoxyinosine glycosylase [Chloroflexi bacterium]|nr:DNA-deoxyinosine glycosylase [Chloroflexota bacterium]